MQLLCSGGLKALGETKLRSCVPPWTPPEAMGSASDRVAR